MRGAAAMLKGSERSSDAEERFARSTKTLPWLEGTFLGDTSGWRILFAAA